MGLLDGTLTSGNAKILLMQKTWKELMVQARLAGLLNQNVRLAEIR